MPVSNSQCPGLGPGPGTHTYGTPNTKKRGAAVKQLSTHRHPCPCPPGRRGARVRLGHGPPRACPAPAPFIPPGPACPAPRGTSRGAAGGPRGQCQHNTGSAPAPVPPRHLRPPHPGPPPPAPAAARAFPHLVRTFFPRVAAVAGGGEGSKQRLPSVSHGAGQPGGLVSTPAPAPAWPLSPARSGTGPPRYTTHRKVLHINIHTHPFTFSSHFPSHSGGNKIKSRTEEFEHLENLSQPLP